MTQLPSPLEESCARRAGAPISAQVFTILLAAFFVLALLPATAQTNSRITAVDPASGKVNDTITVTGDSLGKAAVSGVFLSDEQNDHKATIVDQETGKIVFKVPQVKAGDYNVSIQVGNSLLIQPIRFTVQD
ncbi:MAG TPA: IPT/TIG domain-containing protein [Candidatus Acidoferrales bacterium]|nr:IPT/TIG domain-containing protein [Candidatus Acidoferrales bacterium]